jgi:hypothetical protein
MAYYFCPLNTEEECTLLARGDETTIAQAARASNFRVQSTCTLGKQTIFPLISLWSANFKCVKWRKSLWVHHCLIFKI